MTKIITSYDPYLFAHFAEISLDNKAIHERIDDYPARDNLLHIHLSGLAVRYSGMNIYTEGNYNPRRMNGTSNFKLGDALRYPDITIFAGSTLIKYDVKSDNLHNSRIVNQSLNETVAHELQHYITHAETGFSSFPNIPNIATSNELKSLKNKRFLAHLATSSAAGLGLVTVSRYGLPILHRTSDSVIDATAFTYGFGLTSYVRYVKRDSGHATVIDRAFNARLAAVQAKTIEAYESHEAEVSAREAEKSLIDVYITSTLKPRITKDIYTYRRNENFRDKLKNKTIIRKYHRYANQYVSK